MTYQSLMRAAEVALALWLVALMALVLWRLLIRANALSGLLKTVPSDGQQVERTQSLAVVLAIVAYYVAASAAAIAGAGPHKMPELPDALLALAGGSQAVFLAGKTARYRRR